MMDTTDIILCSESMVALQFLNIDLGPYVHVKASSNVHMYVAAQTITGVRQVVCIITAI